MQPTVMSDRAGLRLIQRILDNRAVMVDLRAKSAIVREAAQETRTQSRFLRKQAGESLGILVDEVLAVKEWRAARPAGPGTPPFRLPHRASAPPDPVDAARSELHTVYAANGDQATRAELMSSYDGFARSLALKYRHRESVDDLVQVARIGLLHAIDRFDPDLGRPFPLFARITHR